MKTKNNRLIKRKTNKIKKGGMLLPPLVTRTNIEAKLQNLLKYIGTLNNGEKTTVSGAKILCQTLINSFNEFNKPSTVLNDVDKESTVLNDVDKESTVLNDVDKSDKNLERAIKKLNELIPQLKTNSSQEDTSLSKKMSAFVSKYKFEDKLKKNGESHNEVFSKHLIQIYLKSSSVSLNSVLIKLESLKNGDTIISMDIPSELASAISQLFIINKIMITLSRLSTEINKNKTNIELMEIMPIEFINIIRRLHKIIVFIKQIPHLKNVDFFGYNEFTELETMVDATYLTASNNGKGINYSGYKAPSAHSVLNETHKNNF